MSDNLSLMRPKIICHMMGSIDGRLLHDRWTPPAQKITEDWYERAAARFHADGWIVGRSTIQEMVASPGPQRKTSRPKGRIPRETHVADRRGRDLAIAIDPHGKVRYKSDNLRGDHLVAVLGEKVSDGYLSELRELGVSYVFAGADGRDLPAAMNALGRAFGLEVLLLEGGGKINGGFLKAHLIDEISLLVYPGIDGLSGVPSIFEYVGTPGEKPARGLALRHLATKTLTDGVVWVRYAVEKAPVRKQSYAA